MAIKDYLRPFIEAMLKQLPPSAAELRLLDVGGMAGDILGETRHDLTITTATTDAQSWSFAENSFDAIVALGQTLSERFLSAMLSALRPGGRLIVIHTEGTVSETPVRTLENAGYIRILVEPATEQGGLLMRGEKPHTTADTLERVRGVAGQDADSLDLSNFKGRYVHLLIVQTPNKPVWALAEGEKIRWKAVSASGQLLAFSSLPKAVSFMQSAVLANVITGINKVGKFSKDTAQTWTTSVHINATLDDIHGQVIDFIDIDPESAEAPDE